jgi:hypothetical protein
VALPKCHKTCCVCVLRSEAASAGVRHPLLVWSLYRAAGHHRTVPTWVVSSSVRGMILLCDFISETEAGSRICGRLAAGEHLKQFDTDARAVLAEEALLLHNRGGTGEKPRTESGRRHLGESLGHVDRRTNNSCIDFSFRPTKCTLQQRLSLQPCSEGTI